jgi:hypothetical protein
MNRLDLWDVDRDSLQTCLLVCAILIPPCSLYGQDCEVSGNGGLGLAERNSFGLQRVSSAGAAFGCSFLSRHKLQFDYTFGHIERETEASGGYSPSIHNRHFFTASYVLQKRQGRYRPFLQIGGGVQYETNNDNQVVNRYLNSGARTSVAGIVGGGLTIRLSSSVFVRPQIRAYPAAGPGHTVNVTALPSCALGWQF